MPGAVFDTPGPVVVKLDVPTGGIRVDAADGSSVEVDVRPARDNEGSRRLAEETRIECAERGGRYEVSIEAPKQRGLLASLRGAAVDVSVRCPPACDVELRSASADLVAQGGLGLVTVQTASGDVRLERAVGLVANSASGDVAAGEIRGEAIVKTASGDVELGVTHGDLTANVVSGDLHVRESHGPVLVTSVSGDVQVDVLSGGGLTASSVSGDVHVGVSGGLALWIDAQSVSGTLDCDLELDDAPADGADVLELRARTVSGDVRIARVRDEPS